MNETEKAAMIEQMAATVGRVADEQERKDGEAKSARSVEADARGLIVQAVVSLERAAWSRSRRGVNAAWAQLNAVGIVRPATFADTPAREAEQMFKGQPLGEYDIHTDSFWIASEQRWVPSVEIAAHGAFEQRTGAETT